MGTTVLKVATLLWLHIQKELVINCILTILFLKKVRLVFSCYSDMKSKIQQHFVNE